MNPSPTTIRTLHAQDIPAFHRLCEEDPLRWHSTRLNLDCYGVQSLRMRSWGVFAADNQTVLGVALRFSNTMVTVDSAGECAPLFARHIDLETGIAGVRGTHETVAALRSLLTVYRPTGWEDSYYMTLSHPPQCPPETFAFARPAQADDLEKLIALYSVAGNMYRSPENIASKFGKERIFVVEEPETAFRAARIVSSALINSENHEAGMIGGVFTLPEARNRGYARACVSALSADLQRDGKIATLFYENPAAGAIYRAIGYQTVSQWALLYLSPRNGRLAPR